MAAAEPSSGADPAREGDSFGDPLDVAREAPPARRCPSADRHGGLHSAGRARGRGARPAARSSAEPGCVRLGPQFVNNGITAYRAQRPAGIVHAELKPPRRRTAGTERAGCIMAASRSGRWASANPGPETTSLAPVSALSDAGVVQSVRTLAPEGFRPTLEGGPRYPRQRAAAGLQRPRVYIPAPVAEVSLATTTCSGNRGEVDAGHSSGGGVITPVRPDVTGDFRSGRDASHGAGSGERSGSPSTWKWPARWKAVDARAADRMRRSGARGCHR